MSTWNYSGSLQSSDHFMSLIMGRLRGLYRFRSFFSRIHWLYQHVITATLLTATAFWKRIRSAFKGSRTRQSGSSLTEDALILYPLLVKWTCKALPRHLFQTIKTYFISLSEMESTWCWWMKNSVCLADLWSTMSFPIQWTAKPERGDLIPGSLVSGRSLKRRGSAPLSKSNQRM